MSADDDALAASLAIFSSGFDDAELDRRVSRFRDRLRQLRDDPAEAARIDALVMDAGPGEPDLDDAHSGHSSISGPQPAASPAGWHGAQVHQPADPADIVARIRALMPGLDPAGRRVAALALSDPGQAARWTISEMAERAQTSGATITGFCRALGLDSYPALRIALAAAAGSGAAGTWRPAGGGGAARVVRMAGQAGALALVVTEQADPQFADLDRLPVPQLVELLTAQARRAGEAVAAASAQIAPVVEAVVKRLAIGGRLIYVGAGTAGRIGTLDAAEARPTFSVPDGTVVGVLAGGMQAFGRSVENVEDDPAAGADALDRLGVGERDAVLGISASGRTPFVLGAMRRASELGAATACLACNENTPLGELAQFPIEIRVGPEVIAGSTRMNAGTVQKIVLNTISTAAMVRLGKTYGSLMVDVRPTNTKLRERAVRIVTTITGVSAREARRALIDSGWRPKVASIVAAYHLDPDEASALLEKSGDRLRDALNAAARRPPPPGKQQTKPTP